MIDSEFDGSATPMRPTPPQETRTPPPRFPGDPGISRPCFCGPRSPIDEWARSGPRRRPTIWGTWPRNLSPPIGINHLEAGGTEMPKIWVYAELNQGRLTTTTLELLTRARELGEVDAVALGPGARKAAAALGKHGAERVFANEDAAFAEYVAEPATDCLAALLPQEGPDLILFGFSPDSREVAGR